MPKKQVATKSGAASQKRKRTEKVEQEPALGKKSKASRSARRQKTPVPTNHIETDKAGATLTRQRKKALGQTLANTQDEPERFLQRHSREQAKTARNNQPKEMDRQTGSGGHRGEPYEDEEGIERQTLHGLLRRLGAGFGDGFPGMGIGSSARIKSIIAMLKEEGDEGQHLTGLTELCEYLAIATEETMVSFPIDQIVPMLISFLGYEHNPEVMLLAARALTNLADVFPPSCSYIIRHNAVPAFCARLLSIEFIDLAEQSLQALEKLSHEHPGSLLRAGALMAVLQYVDFFQTGVQRVAVATAANICRGLSPDNIDAVSAASPILINLLRYSDAKIVDSACLALTRIADSFSRSPEQMKTLVDFGLIDSIVEMVSVNETGSITSQLSSSTFYGLVKILASCASGSHVVAERLLQVRISSTLRNLLATSPMLSATSASPGNALRSADQLQALVTLASYLLPDIPNASTAFLAFENAPKDNEERIRFNSSQSQPASFPFASGPGYGNRATQSTALTTFLRENPEIADQVAEDLLPIMLHVHASSGTSQIKRKTRNVLIKLLIHTSTPVLSKLLYDLPISSLVARLLTNEDSSVVAEGMQIAEILMEKLPEEYSNFFLKEGVVHAMEELASSALPIPATDSVPERTTRSRSRRRSANNGDDVQGAADQEQDTKEDMKEEAIIGQRTPAGTTLRNALAVHAKRFCASYFTDTLGNSVGCRTQGVLKLEDICARIHTPDGIKDLFKALEATGASSISTFELLTSGAVRKLREFLLGDDLTTKNDLTTQPWQLFERLDQFAHIALPAGSGGNPPLTILIDKIQSALTATEKFQLQVTDLSSFPSHYHFLGGGIYGSRGSRSTGPMNNISAGLSALGNPFKIRLVRHSTCTNTSKVLRDYSSSIVLIEPLASVTQVEDFLWHRVRLSASEMRERQQEQERRASGADVAPPGNDNNNAVPPRRMTRAQARAAAEAEVVAQGNNTNGDNNNNENNTSEQQQPPPTKNQSDQTAQQNRNPMEARRTRRGGPSSSVPITAPLPTASPRRRITTTTTTDDDNGVVAMSEDIHLDNHRRNDDDDDDDDDGNFNEEDFHHEEDEEEDEEEDIDTDYEDEYIDDVEDDDDGGEGMMRAAAMHVHDMHLAEDGNVGTGAETQDAGEQHEPSSLLHNNSRHGNQEQRNGGASRHSTYASAAAGAGSSRQESGLPASPRLVFYYNGQIIEQGTTIFQAVRASIAASESTSPSGRSLTSRLWHDVHTMTYRLYEDAIKERDEKIKAEEKSKDGDLMDVEVSNPPLSDHFVLDLENIATSLATSPLSELLNPPSAFITATSDPKGPLGAISSDCLDVIVVLNQLEALNRLAGHLHSALEGHNGRNIPSTLLLGRVSREMFISGRLGPKLTQQLKDVISICSGALPPWCTALTSNARFLFPFEVRRHQFYCTAFGLSRALHYLQQTVAAEEGEGGRGAGAGGDREPGSLRVARLQRQKVRLHRRKILESAHRVFELYSASKSQLEVEFFGEVGTGLGPTLEFYTLLSHELQRKSLGLWRDEDIHQGKEEEMKQQQNTTVEGIHQPLLARTISGPGPLRGEIFTGVVDGVTDESQGDDNVMVHAPLGLFPRPLTPSERDDDGFTARHFRLLGRVVAKALQDSRLLDLPISPVFYRRVLGRKVDLYTLREIDPGLSMSLERLYVASQAVAGTNQPAVVDGCPVEDLCLTFVLPGYPAYELCPGGADVSVTTANVRQYIHAVVDASLGTGISTQVEAFRSGFNAIYPISHLDYFYEDEIEAMVCGSGESWTPTGLAAVIKFDHGYTATSAPVLALLEVLSELDAVDQRRFLRFVTGAPRLPAGGVAALQPRLTVVRKLTNATIGPGGEIIFGTSVASSGPGVSGSLGGPGDRNPIDRDLPSVMTCANYLKLPPYSTKEILRERLLFAIREGQGSFDLS